MKYKSIWLGVVATTLYSFSLPVLADLTMGVFPRRPPAQTQQMFAPLADKIGAELGEKVTLVTPKDFPSFWQGVSRGDYDIVHFNQYHYIEAKDQFGYEIVAANIENGSKTITPSIAVRKDSGITSIEDLKGKTVMFGGGKKAMVNYIAPKALLKRHGLIEGKDFTSKFAKLPTVAVIGVYNNASDAATTGAAILNSAGLKQKIDTSQLQIIAQSEPLVHLPWAVKGSLPSVKKEQIAATMLSIKPDDEIMKKAKLEGLQKVSDDDYQKIREISDYAFSD